MTMVLDRAAVGSELYTLRTGIRELTDFEIDAVLGGVDVTIEAFGASVHITGEMDHAMTQAVIWAVGGAIAGSVGGGAGSLAGAIGGALAGFAGSFHYDWEFGGQSGSGS